MTNVSASQRQRAVREKGPTGTVTAQYGNEAGATFAVTPENTAGLRAGAVVRDGAGKLWMVDDNYLWAPYTGAGQWQAVSAIDDARQKLVQDWYDSGRDPANTQAADMEAWLKQQGRLGAQMHSVIGPGLREQAGRTGAGGESGVPGAAAEAAATDTQDPAASEAFPGSPADAAPAAFPASASGTPFQRVLNDYELRRDRIMDELEQKRFSYDPAADPLWQSYQKQYRREGQRAAEDALGRAAANTGGAASSWAVTAAAQAGNEYAAQLSDRFPEVYQSAYDRYLREYERLLALADAYDRYGKRENEWQQALRAREEQ